MNNKNWLVAMGMCLSIFSQTVVSDAPTEYKRNLETRFLTARIVAIDHKARTVSAVLEDGSTKSLTAGPEAENFDSINKDDNLKVVYTRDMLFTKMPKGSATQRVETGIGNLAETGEYSTRTSLMAYTISVEVNAVDMENRRVSYTDRDGLEHSMLAKDEASHAFLRELSTGDLVEITYIEKIALADEVESK